MKKTPVFFLYLILRTFAARILLPKKNKKTTSLEVLTDSPQKDLKILTPEIFQEMSYPGSSYKAKIR